MVSRRKQYRSLGDVLNFNPSAQGSFRGVYRSHPQQLVEIPDCSHERLQVAYEALQPGRMSQNTSQRNEERGIFRREGSSSSLSDVIVRIRVVSRYRTLEQKPIDVVDKIFDSW